MIKFKFVHDDIQNRNYSTVETVVELEESLDFFQLISELKKVKGSKHIDVIEIYKEVFPDRWFKLQMNYKPQEIKQLINV